MRAFRIIAAISLIGFCILLGIFLWSIFSPDAGRTDAFATARIRNSCGFRAICKVRIGDLFDGDWDTFYEFGADVPQQQIDRTLGSVLARAGEHQRTMVLTRNGRVVRVAHTNFGRDQPLDGEIEFENEHNREQQIIRYSRDTWLRVTSFPTNADGRHGTFSVLTAVDN